LLAGFGQATSLIRSSQGPTGFRRSGFFLSFFDRRFQRVIGK
jgi:hypothetical protein